MAVTCPVLTEILFTDFLQQKEIGKALLHLYYYQEADGFSFPLGFRIMQMKAQKQKLSYWGRIAVKNLGNSQSSLRHPSQFLLTAHLAPLQSI